MNTHLVGYLATAIVLLGIDFAWLTIMGPPLYRRTLGDVLVQNFRIIPAVAFYLLYTAGIMTFAVFPALDANLWTTALVQGALFGFFAYATYSLTNHATLRNWSTTITLVDLGWGTTLTAVSATFGYLIVGLIGGL
jgi:uncharacterized membrane protein